MGTGTGFSLAPCERASYSFWGSWSLCQDLGRCPSHATDLLGPDCSGVGSSPQMCVLVEKKDGAAGEPRGFKEILP